MTPLVRSSMYERARHGGSVSMLTRAHTTCTGLAAEMSLSKETSISGRQLNSRGRDCTHQALVASRLPHHPLPQTPHLPVCLSHPACHKHHSESENSALHPHHAARSAFKGPHAVLETSWMAKALSVQAHPSRAVPAIPRCWASSLAKKSKTTMTSMKQGECGPSL